ncbi:MAG: DUF6634 family protein [Devosia sp.]|uniref:DUF6634 family protein n=1 Tax=Devosia sp. TaxID=1871048 RepID=UPI0033988911
MVRLSRKTVRDGLQAALAIRTGKLPTKAEIEQAPQISKWAWTANDAGFARLFGWVEGHPRLGTGWCTTSVVLAMDTERRWARTVSRLYRLAEPLSPEE